MNNQMLLQGDLQKVFDALYYLGMIDSTLEMDWCQEFDFIKNNPYSLAKLLTVVNSSSGNYKNLMETLQNFKQQDLGHLAMIVAHELACSQTNKVIH